MRKTSINMLDECREGKDPMDVMKEIEEDHWNATGTYWHWKHAEPFPLFIWFIGE